jgi:surface antigen
LFKPLRQVTHLSLVIVIIIVLLTGIPVIKLESTGQIQSSVDPFGVNSMTKEIQASEKVTTVETVASIASVIDPSMGEEAFQIADSQAAKTSYAISGDAISALPYASTSSSANGKAGFQRYVVQTGDTLSGIASQFGITTDSIKWSNGMSDADFVKPGQTLNIPSITGIIYTVRSGDSIEGIASRFKSSSSLIIAQNDLYGESIKAGMVLVVPDGEIVDTPAQPQQTQTGSRGRITSRGSVPSYVQTSRGPNRFPWGWCTWYVASRRYVPWNGNAAEWYWNAQRYGRSVGKTPVPGAIYVSWESSVGHVAYVESVGNGSYTISEMNARGFGVISRRTIRSGSVPLIGFIY